MIMHVKLKDLCSCGSKYGHMNGHDLVCDSCKKVVKVFNFPKVSKKNSLYRQVPQVDVFACLRCGQVRAAAFAFDDGTFYCFSCFDFMCNINAYSVFGGVPFEHSLVLDKGFMSSDELKGGD